MRAIQLKREYVAPVLGFSNGRLDLQIKLWALRLGVRFITSHEYPLTWFAFCPAPAGLTGFSIYLRRFGLGWRWQP